MPPLRKTLRQQEEPTDRRNDEDHTNQPFGQDRQRHRGIATIIEPLLPVRAEEGAPKAVMRYRAEERQPRLGKHDACEEKHPHT